MAAVWALARARLRGRRRALLGLTVLIGVAAGAVMAAAIGARRTETAYPRLLQATLAQDLQVGVGGYAEDHPGYVDRLRRLPQVGDLGLASVAFMAPDVGLGPPSPRRWDRAPVISTDGRYGWTVNRPLVLAGDDRTRPGRRRCCSASPWPPSCWRWPPWSRSARPWPGSCSWPPPTVPPFGRWG
jgi:hypothetical protein